MGARTILFLIGGLLMLGGFVAAAFEAMAHFQGAPDRAFLTAFELWYTYWPTALVLFQGNVESALGVPAWTWLVRPVLAVPAWLLLGGPGLLLLWLFRPPRDESDMGDGPDTEALDIYDELARQARDEGYADSVDDMAPDHAPHTDLSVASEDDYRDLDTLMREAEAEADERAAERRDGENEGETPENSDEQTGDKQGSEKPPIRPS